ncbi:unnamed protein product [Porites evermanni]|uniref:Nuclear speckle splicing regulatory protein 1 N-terminal domain-containing protein n=1 Tax=Porites evermanni TaxID=104178 RepID=A0ABN8R268_9CNID|nr:unnamed protein product [Porites evermanni]
MKQTQIEIQKALREDPTVYEYDAVYDEMEEKKKAANVKVPEKDRKPKYIEGLLKSAAARKREYERTVERQVQKERENEEGQFNDKEAFVTEAFRKKMQEQAEEEERLKRQEAIDAANDVTKQKDLSLFYRNLLNRNVSLGGSFTADNATKTDSHEEKNNRGKSKLKEGEATQDTFDDKQSEKHKNKDDKRHSTSEESSRESKGRPSSPRHSRHQDHGRRKRRDSESDEDGRKQSSDSPERERRRHSDKERHDKEHRKKSSHSERHRSSYDDNRHSDHSRTSHDDRRERDRKRDRGERDRKEIDSAEKTDKESSNVDQKPKESKEKVKEETVGKFAKRSTDETVMSAKERYLARKRARDAEKTTMRNDDSDEE